MKSAAFICPRKSQQQVLMLLAACLAVLTAQGAASDEPWGMSTSRGSSARRLGVVTLWNEALPSVSVEVSEGAWTASALVNSHSAVDVPLGPQPGTLHVRVFTASNASLHEANVSYGAGTLDVGVSVAVLDCNGTLCVKVLVDNLQKHLNDGIDVARLRVRKGGEPWARLAYSCDRQTHAHVCTVGGVGVSLGCEL